MKNAALALQIEFDTLHARVQNMIAHNMTPPWVLETLDGLLLSLEKLQGRRRVLAGGGKDGHRNWRHR